MDSSIYFPLFLVLKAANGHAIYYLPVDSSARTVLAKETTIGKGPEGQDGRALCIT